MNDTGTTNPALLVLSAGMGSRYGGLKPTIFSHLEHAIRKLLDAMGNDPKAESEWFGVTYPEDRTFLQNEIKKLIQNRQYPDPLINH